MRLVNADHAPVYLNEEACKQIKNMPTVDAVEVVRCKDCKHMKIIEGTSVLYCFVWLNANGFGDHGYCNYGERKEGADSAHSICD